ncbi:MAG: hypothetical protein IJZ23_11575 [Roseburia sp.]|nr:hypothetical protein [Roseburia sp.]
MNDFVPPAFNLKIDTSDLDNAMNAITMASQEKWEREQRLLEATEATANNTAETNERLNTIIDNQNDYICLLKEQLAQQKKQIEANEEQLLILRNIFASTEDGISVEKEIMRLILNEIDDKHPWYEFFRDKTGDLAVAGVSAGAPVIYAALKTYLISQGITLP